MTDSDEDLSFARGDATPQLKLRESMITRALSREHQSPKSDPSASRSTAMLVDDEPTVKKTAAATTTTFTHNEPTHCINTTSEKASRSTNRSENSDRVEEIHASVLTPKETRTQMLRTELPEKFRKELYKERQMNRPVPITNAQGMPMQPARRQKQLGHSGDSTASPTAVEFAPQNYHTRGW